MIPITGIYDPGIRPAPRGGCAPATRPKPKQNLSKKEKQEHSCVLPLVGTEHGGSEERMRKSLPEIPSAR